MARIPEAELARLKREISLERLAESRGVKLKRHGKDLLGLCPFHDDREPSLVISPKTNLWHCLGACQAGGSVIDWVMRDRGVSFRHAVELLRADLPATTSTAAPPPPPVAAEAEDGELLRRVVGYYHEALKESPEAPPEMRGRRRVPTLVGDRGDPRGLAVLGTEYLTWLAVHGYAHDTVASTAHGLNRFARWAEMRGIAQPGVVTRPMLERYQRHLYVQRQPSGKPLSFSTQYNRLSALRGFFRWLVRENYILHNPASELVMPKLPQRLPKQVLSVAEAEQVLRQPDISEPLGLRDRALLEVLYSSGIRRMELVGLEIYDIDASRGWLAIRHAKGGKERVVPLGARALAWLDKYLSAARSRLLVRPDEPALFVTHEGKAMTPNYVTHRVRGYVEASGITKTGACHLFRHTAATLMLEGGADIRYIQQMLGHAKLETTQIYTRVSIQKLKAIHDATHPGARLKQREDAEASS